MTPDPVELKTDPAESGRGAGVRHAGRMAPYYQARDALKAERAAKRAAHRPGDPCYLCNGTGKARGKRIRRTSLRRLSLLGACVLCKGKGRLEEQVEEAPEARLARGADLFSAFVTGVCADLDTLSGNGYDPFVRGAGLEELEWERGIE